MKKQNIDWRIVIAAIGAITILEAIALMKGINGSILTIVVAIVAGLAGLVTPVPNKFKQM